MGRVERLLGVLQDCLGSELWLGCACDLDSGCRELVRSSADYDSCFTRMPRQTETCWRHARPRSGPRLVLPGGADRQQQLRSCSGRDAVSTCPVIGSRSVLPEPRLSSTKLRNGTSRSTLKTRRYKTTAPAG